MDNYKKKWGSNYINGWNVSPPDLLLEENTDEIVVLISGYHTSEIGKQLDSMGVRYYFSEV